MADVFDKLLDSQQPTPAASAAPQAGGRDVIDAILDQHQDAQRQQLKGILDVVSPINPDKAAEAVKLSRSSGLPEQTVQDNLDEVKRQERLRLLNLQRVMADSPVLARQLTDPNFAKLSHDNVENLGAIESTARYIFGGENQKNTLLGDAYAGAQLASRGAANVFRAGFELTAPILDPLTGTILPENPLRRVAEGFANLGNTSKQVADYYSPATEGNVQGGVSGGVKSFVQNMLGLPLAFATGGESAFLTYMSATTGGQAYGDARDAGLSAVQAVPFATSQAVIEYATEKLPVKYLLGDLKAGSSFYKIFAHQLMTEMPSEQVATILQDLNEWAILHPDRPFSDYLEQRPDAAIQTAIATAIGVGGNVAVSKGLEKAFGTSNIEKQKANQANITFDLLNRLDQLAGADVVRGRDVETFASFMQAVENEHQGPVNTLYIDPKTLIETLTAAGANIQEVIATVPSLTNLQEQAAVGTDIAIPVSDFATHIAGSDYAQALLPQLKADPTGMSKAQADEYMQTHSEQLKAEVERVIGEQDDKAQFKASLDKVKADIKTQLAETSRFREDVNEAYSTLMATFYATTGAKLGLTPEQMAAKYPVKIAASAVNDGQQYDQAGQLKTDTPNFKNWFKSSKVVDEQGKPMVLYHGAKSGDITQFNTSGGKGKTHGTGLFMSADPSVANTYTPRREGGTIYPVYVSMQNPLVVDFAGKNWNQGDNDSVIELPDGTQDSLLDYFGAGQDETVSTDDVARLARERGHDGVIIRNVIDNGAYDVPEHDGATDLYVAFEPTQIKSVNNQGEFNPNDPNILNQDQRDLLIQHNLSAENLLHAVKMGGIPVPSLAVTKKESPLTNFGEITLLGDKDMADPRGGGKPKVFGADIYSPRYPTISYKLDKFATKRLNGALAPYRQEGEREIYSSDIDRVDDLTSDKAFKRYAEEKLGGTSSWSQTKQLAAQMLSNAGADEKIFTGYSYSGNRKYIDHNIENVVKLLKKELRGGEGFNYGVGSLRAKFTPEFKSIKAIRENKDRLMSAAEFDKVKEEIDNEFIEIGTDLGLSLDQTIEVMEDVPRMGAKRAIERALTDYKDGGEPSADQISDVAEFVVKLRNLPTAYFEAKILRNVELSEFSGAVVPENVDPKVIEALKERGITDIRTYDGSETDRTAKIGEFDNLFFQKQGEARGTFNPETMTITLLKAANLSTFLHESGHFFLEVNADIASRQDAPAEMVQDMQTVLNWFGVQDLATWQAMDIEAKREYHEKFARGFEAYLFEGKAPNTELQGLFQRFRSWLVNIYKQLSGLNVELDEEIRGVFDRMLASSESIKEAEQARSFAPLFTTKPPFMTDEEWLAYQQTDVQSAQDAVSDLETRSLRDMQWLTNAKSRLLKAMQKENAELRKEVRREVAAEVMAEPVYRAREFFKRGTLDGEAVETPVKLSIDALEAIYGEEKLPREKKVKQTNGFMDFLVKFGINISDKGNVGADSKAKYRVGLFVKQGTSLDVLAQNAVEYGYLTQADIDSETDNGGVNKLTDMIQRALAGERILTMEEQVQEAANRYDTQSEEDADIPDIGGASNVGTKQAMRDLGFSDAEIDEILSNQFWKKLGFGKYGMLANGENTITPSQAAELFGFTSGDHLIRALVDAPDPRGVIEQRTDDTMMERYGDINSQQALSRAADEAIHNDARVRFVATEANALAKAVGKPKLVSQAAKQYAADIINRLKIRNIKAGQYAASAARAGREAAKSKDLVEQATAKRNQLINTYAAKAAYEAQDEVIKGVRYLTRFDGKNITKTVHVDSLEQIWSLLDRFDLRSSTTLKAIDRKKSLIQWVEAQRAKGEEPVVPPSLLDEAYRTSYKELTLEEFRGLVDAVRNIEHLGRLKTKLIKIQDQREFKAVSGEAGEVIRENATKDIAQQLEQKGIKDAVTSNGREVLAWHRKFASLIRQMDGFKDGGFLWSTFVKPMNEAGTQEASMREQATVKLGELYKLLGKAKLDKKTYIPEINASLSLEGRIAIALNMGNETNMRRVMEGEGWSAAQVNAIVGSLTRDQWNFVQGTWDFLNSYWPEISAKERRLTGIVPEKVEAKPFMVTLQDGTQVSMAGGYYPIKYNAKRSSKSAADAAADVLKQMERGLYARAQTARGHIEARAESVGRPMRYDLGVIDQHLNQVIHDLSWHEYLIDANRLLASNPVDTAVRDHYGPEVMSVMRKTLEDIAIGELPTQGVIERGVRYIRSGVSIASMGWNLSTAFLQPLGLTQSMVRIGPKWVAKGMGRWLRDASALESTVEWVGQKSEFMRLRSKTMQREISEIRNTISKGETMSMVEGSFFYLIGKLQLVADIPTWVGMYEKAMAEGNNEDRAIALADQAVLDSQGGGQIKDMAMVQRGGEWQKLWTNFYSYFSVTYNQLAESVGETQKVGASRLPLLAVDFLMLTAVPATLGFFLKAALKGKLGDDDEDELLKKLAAENISYLMGTMIGLREMNAAVSGSMGYEGPAGARFFADVAKFSKQAYQGDADEAFWRSANELGGVLLHYPALQIDRTVRGMIELSEGGENPLAPLFGPKPKH